MTHPHILGTLSPSGRAAGEGIYFGEIDALSKVHLEAIWWPSSGYLEAIWWPSCGYLEASWGHLEAILGTLPPSCRAAGEGIYFGEIGASQRAILRLSDSLLGTILRPLRGHLVAIWRPRGAILRSSWAPLKPSCRAAAEGIYFGEIGALSKGHLEAI